MRAEQALAFGTANQRWRSGICCAMNSMDRIFCECIRRMFYQLCRLSRVSFPFMLSS